MTIQFHTVKEAAQIIGKSPSSIRRIIYPIIEANSHPDREHIQPSAGEVPELRLKGENFAWRISDELLRRAVPPEEVTPEWGSDPSPEHSLPQGTAELIKMLRGELEIKNQQITQQTAMLSQQIELISGLSERLREGNVLIGTLQQQLRLGDGVPPSKTNVVDAKAAKPESKAHATKPAAPKPAPKPLKPKRGFFGRLFHSTNSK